MWSFEECFRLKKDAEHAVVANVGVEKRVHRSNASGERDMNEELVTLRYKKSYNGFHHPGHLPAWSENVNRLGHSSHWSVNRTLYRKCVRWSIPSHHCRWMKDRVALWQHHEMALNVYVVVVSLTRWEKKNQPLEKEHVYVWVMFDLIVQSTADTRSWFANHQRMFLVHESNGLKVTSEDGCATRLSVTQICKWGQALNA